MISQTSLYPSVSLGNNTLSIWFLSKALSNYVLFLPTEVSVTLNLVLRSHFFLKKDLFIFGCTGSSLLHTGALQLWQVGATLRCGEQASHALDAEHGLNGTQASVVAARRLSARGTQA